MDALELLRECVMENRHVSFDGDMLVLEDQWGAKIGYPKRLPTPMVDPRSKKSYPLGAVWLVHSTRKDKST